MGGFIGSAPDERRRRLSHQKTAEKPSQLDYKTAFSVRAFSLSCRASAAASWVTMS